MQRKTHYSSFHIIFPFKLKSCVFVVVVMVVVVSGGGSGRRSPGVVVEG